MDTNGKILLDSPNIRDWEEHEGRFYITRCPQKGSQIVACYEPSALEVLQDEQRIGSKLWEIRLSCKSSLQIAGFHSVFNYFVCFAEEQLWIISMNKGKLLQQFEVKNLIRKIEFTSSSILVLHYKKPKQPFQDSISWR